jgi:hypothetical protein
MARHTALDDRFASFHADNLNDLLDREQAIVTKKKKQKEKIYDGSGMSYTFSPRILSSASDLFLGQEASKRITDENVPHWSMGARRTSNIL